MAETPIIKARTQVVSELGSTGLRHYSGTVVEEFIRDLRGKRSVEVFREMRDNDPTIGAMLFAIEMMLRQVKWQVVPLDKNSAEDTGAAEFVEECRHDMSHPWSEFVAEVLSMVTFGWSYHEIVYKVRGGGNPSNPDNYSKYSDGRIGWSKIPIRSQDTLMRWELSDQGDVLGMHQLAPPKFVPVFIPIERSILFRTTMHKNNPEGRSMLRNAYRPWFFKRRVEEFEAIGIERDLAGFPVMYLPARLMSDVATEAEKQLYKAYKDIVSSIKRDEQEGLVLPSDLYPGTSTPMFKLELLSSASRRMFDINQVVTRRDREILSTCMADFIMLGHEKVGSFALSSDKTSLFAVGLGSLLDMIAGTFNRSAIPRLLEINGIAGRAELTHGDLEEESVTTLVTNLKELSNIGMELFPDENLDSHLRQRLDLPPKSYEGLGYEERMAMSPSRMTSGDQEDDEEDQSEGDSAGDSP